MKNFAVVGGGISGLSAVWLLNEYSEHQVELFEGNDYIGGHTNTVLYNSPTGSSCAVDTGFIVFNQQTYPNFITFLNTLGVDFIQSNMSFSVKRSFGPPFEWSGNRISSLFNGIQTWSDFFSQFQLFWDLIRFNHLVIHVLFTSEGDLTIQEYLLRHRYSEAFKRNYLLPMISSIWSTPANETAMLFPMKTLVRFLSNHHLLQIFNQPQWLTIKNGSKNYVNKILSKLDTKKCYKSTLIKTISIEETSKKIYLKDEIGQVYGPYDQVIFASHADQTYQILKNSPCSHLFNHQIHLLSCFKFNKNLAVLHNDPSLMPRNRQIWSSWNYTITDPPLLSNQLTSNQLDQNSIQEIHASNIEETVSLTYWMNLLQSIPEKIFGPIFVTLNPPHEINPKFVFGRWNYEHPLYTNQSVKAQSKITTIQTKEGLSFIGAWTNYGFHEDGLTSTLKLFLLEKPEVFNINQHPFQNFINNHHHHHEFIKPNAFFTKTLINSIHYFFLFFFKLCYFLFLPYYFFFSSKIIKKFLVKFNRNKLD